jgi:hypothetical protein
MMSFIQDYNTKNESFIKMAVKLKKLKISNNEFFLALLNKDLIGVHPWDPNLSTAQKVEIMRECILNPWYYFREVIRLETMGGGFETFKLNFNNLSKLYLHLNDISSIDCGIRQVGKTIVERAIHSYNFKFTNRPIYVIPRTNTTTEYEDYRNKTFNFINIPDYLKITDTNKSIKMCDNKNNVIYREMSNAFTKSKIITINNIEKYSDKIVPGAIACVDDLVLNNKYLTHEISYAYCERHLLTFPVLINSKTSANKLKVYNKCMHATKFELNMFDLNQEQLRRLLDRSYNDMMLISFNPAELGYDRVKFESECRLLNCDIETIQTELLGLWVSECNNMDDVMNKFKEMQDNNQYKKSL